MKCQVYSLERLLMQEFRIESYEDMDGFEHICDIDTMLFNAFYRL